MILVSASSALECFRSMVLLRRLHVQRAAVIHSTGCAVLNGDDGRVEGARAELRLLDELITAVSMQTTLAFRPGESATAAAEVSNVALGPNGTRGRLWSANATAARDSTWLEDPIEYPCQRGGLLPSTGEEPADPSSTHVQTVTDASRVG